MPDNVKQYFTLNNSFIRKVSSISSHTDLPRWGGGGMGGRRVWCGGGLRPDSKWRTWYVTQAGHPKDWISPHKVPRFSTNLHAPTATLKGFNTHNKVGSMETFFMRKYYYFCIKMTPRDEEYPWGLVQKESSQAWETSPVLMSSFTTEHNQTEFQKPLPLSMSDTRVNAKPQNRRK